MTKVVFFGTSDRSVPILEALKRNFDLALCITKEDVLVGRHQTPKETQVKTWAKANGVNFVTIKESLAKEKGTIIDNILSSKAEVGVVADFGYIVPKEILSAFPKGLINIHFSLLPKYRGASPVQFAILNGDAQTGITFQLMEYTLDTGPILRQIPYPLTGAETCGELYSKLFDLAGTQLPVVLRNYLDGEITPTPQDESKATYTSSPSHPKNTYIYKEDAKLNLAEPACVLERKVRAYNPWPVAWTTLDEMQRHSDKIAGFTRLRKSADRLKTVKIYASRRTLDGRLGILTLQLEGGKVLAWEEFAHGYLA